MSSKRRAYKRNAEEDELAALKNKPAEILNEEEQENLISALATQDSTQNTIYRSVLSALGLMTCILYGILVYNLPYQPLWVIKLTRYTDGSRVSPEFGTILFSISGLACLLSSVPLYPLPKQARLIILASVTLLALVPFIGFALSVHHSSLSLLQWCLSGGPLGLTLVNLYAYQEMISAASDLKTLETKQYTLRGA